MRSTILQLPLSKYNLRMLRSNAPLPRQPRDIPIRLTHSIAHLEILVRMRHRFPRSINNRRSALDLGSGEFKDPGAGDLLEVLVFDKHPYGV
jgi:hypothetical protein